MFQYLMFLLNKMREKERDLKQEAHGPQNSPEKQILAMNKFKVSYHYTSDLIHYYQTKGKCIDMYLFSFQERMALHLNKIEPPRMNCATLPEIVTVFLKEEMKI